MRKLVLLAFAIFAFQSPIVGQPCTAATPECIRWLKLGEESRSLVYSTYPLDKKNERIVRALVIVHGAGRDADNYFRTGLAAAFLAGALDNTIVISPRFAANNVNCRDTLAANEVNWPCAGGDTWRSGGVATNDAKLTSYDFMDAIVRALVRKENFPNLKSIVISGHSAGGQFATRYGMANQIHDSAGVAITYIISNPSSYSYLDPERPEGANNELRPFGDARNCTRYDSWPYGLNNRTGYTAKIPDAQLKKQMAARAMVYLLSELDTLPLAGFDDSCPAMAQGPTRFARGQAYAAYVKAKYNAAHQVVVVPLCGHNARCVFTSEVALPVLFPK